MKFEWLQAKADANVIKHGVTFDLAQSVFSDAFAIDWEDDRADYGEVRHITVGLAADGTVLYVAYTERQDRIRIISARRATQHEQDDYFRQNARE